MLIFLLFYLKSSFSGTSFQSSFFFKTKQKNLFIEPSIGSYDVPGDNTKYYKSPSYR